MNMDELKQEEDALRERVTALPPEKRKAYYALEKKRIKDPDNYAVLNYFFVAGLHHFYLGKTLFGFLNLLGMLIGLLFIETFGIFIFLAIIVIELPQLFRSQRIVYQYNNNVMRQTLKDVESQPLAS
ncbi:TM2 domain-containing protein [Thalassomonas sp. RHCl1]|uniref:TM2 domain-containing protein n=1 Tax=Thalassomonas sp. RHCl1 TaxID=2995320 RepID=UPI00248B123C|nr:TM2 domain-containing protein [Thalassomonas sp. RHCl1]